MNEDCRKDAIPTPAPITVTAMTMGANPLSMASRAKPAAPRQVPTRSRVEGAHFERGTMTLWARREPFPDPVLERMARCAAERILTTRDYAIA